MDYEKTQSEIYKEEMITSLKHVRNVCSLIVNDDSYPLHNRNKMLRIRTEVKELLVKVRNVELVNLSVFEMSKLKARKDLEIKQNER